MSDLEKTDTSVHESGATVAPSGAAVVDRPPRIGSVRSYWWL